MDNEYLGRYGFDPQNDDGSADRELEAELEIDENQDFGEIDDALANYELARSLGRPAFLRICTRQLAEALTK